MYVYSSQMAGVAVAPIPVTAQNIRQGIIDTRYKALTPEQRIALAQLSPKFEAHIKALVIEQMTLMQGAEIDALCHEMINVLHGVNSKTGILILDGSAAKKRDSKDVKMLVKPRAVVPKSDAWADISDGIEDDAQNARSFADVAQRSSSMIVVKARPPPKSVIEKMAKKLTIDPAVIQMFPRDGKSFISDEDIFVNKKQQYVVKQTMVNSMFGWPNMSGEHPRWLTTKLSPTGAPIGWKFEASLGAYVRDGWNYAITFDPVAGYGHWEIPKHVPGVAAKLRAVTCAEFVRSQLGDGHESIRCKHHIKRG